jgi:cytochrome P450
MLMISPVLMDREPVNDYIFADGTKVPAGATLSVALRNANLNPDSYDEPLKFDGFRFIKMKERHPKKNFDMVTTNASSLSFGHGRHVCPGRFFASTEIKLMLAYVVTTYDLKMREEGVRPPDDLFVNRIWPNRSADVLFRSRKLVEVD